MASGVLRSDECGLDHIELLQVTNRLVTGFFFRVLVGLDKPTGIRYLIQFCMKKVESLKSTKLWSSNSNR
jgi:hypothetical protein